MARKNHVYTVDTPNCAVSKLLYIYASLLDASLSFSN